MPLRDSASAASGFLTMAADLTERKSLERQLQQAQKMEAVGRLAGGVAHDFNNLLTVITGYGYMLLEDLANQPVPRGNVEQILRAVDRASALTNQLLAFSRRQVSPPKTIDVNELVLNMDKMLRRVIGEDIELVTALSPDAGKINADPGQIEQVIMNLVVNSRDAMPEGGRITIETANATLDEEYARIHLTARPGEYVMLSVIDTGEGMDEETRAHIFEPFFTTKEPGKGTGLGLAQVYGIVKQSDGEITVESAPSQGTRVQIYLPRISGTVSADEEERGEADRAEGTETVLLVEDEDDVRRLVCEVLEQHGYTVLSAAEPQEAIEICRTYRRQIDLLLTDMVMPQMGGRELADRTGWIRPDMRVLFMSGYTDDAMLGVAVSEPGVAFLKKPFTPAVLTRKIREVLEARPQGLAAAE
jgi:nitrogen-specific signal transduction histidine kinase/ActR/RegA family two-component response regulator